MMSFVRLAPAVCSVLALGACDPSLLSKEQEPATTLALFSGEMTAGAPAGYCFDDNASRPSTGFAVLAPCGTLGAEAINPSIVGLATVQVGPADSGAVEGAEADLRTLLETDAGATLLSGDGSAETVTILSARTEENRVVVHFSDSAMPVSEGLEAKEWRAFLDLHGRLVTVALRGLSAAPLADGEGAALLAEIIAGLTNPIARDIEKPEKLDPWTL